MARKTILNNITTPELIKQINPKNKKLMDDYLMYLKSIQRSETTVNSYKNDLEIFFVWCLKNADNKFFIDITKRDIISYQNYLLYENKNSASRVRRLKATLSSLSNYIENIMDVEYPNFRNIVNKVENPINEPVREKSVFEEDEIQYLLDYLINKKEYQKACLVALAMASGRRKSELVRFKANYFDKENLLYGSLYKTPEKIKTKGRGKGKFLYCYILKSKFQKYFDLWMAQRTELGINSEWLFVSYNNKTKKWEQMNVTKLNSWANSFTKILNKDFYWHSLRHNFCTFLLKSGLPDSVVQEIFGWDSAEMVNIYNDQTTDDQLSNYFDENGIKSNIAKNISEL